MIYRKETSFEVCIVLNAITYYVYGIYYYAPNEKYEDPPIVLYQNDSKLTINEYLEYCKTDCMYRLKEDLSYLDEVEILVWEQLLSEDE